MHNVYTYEENVMENKSQMNGRYATGREYGKCTMNKSEHTQQEKRTKNK